MKWKIWDRNQTAVTDEQIFSAMGAWMLWCAVGAYTKTLSTSGNIDFDLWFMLCRGTWDRISKKLDIHPKRIENVAREYAKKNAHRTYMEVFEAEKTLHPDREAA